MSSPSLHRRLLARHKLLTPEEAEKIRFPPSSSSLCASAPLRWKIFSHSQKNRKAPAATSCRRFRGGCGIRPRPAPGGDLLTSPGYHGKAASLKRSTCSREPDLSTSQLLNHLSASAFAVSTPGPAHATASAKCRKTRLDSTTFYPKLKKKSPNRNKSPVSG